MSRGFSIVAAGDAAVIVRFEERLAPDVNAMARRVAGALGAASLPGIRDVVPSFCAVTVNFDPVRTDIEVLLELLGKEGAGDVGLQELSFAKAVEIPVCYGGEFGPDLREVARFAAMDEAEVIRAHAGVEYRVYMLGFAPGFAYLGEVDPRIAMPRRATPRLRVAAGSVAVAGPQTGVYPSDLPGGWNVIGRTPLTIFDWARIPPSLLRPGDTVTFVPITRERYDTMCAERERGAK